MVKTPDTLQASAKVAEIMVSSKAFRRADNMPYENDAYLTNDQVVAHAEARDAAARILLDTYNGDYSRLGDKEQYWEMQRQAVLAKLGGSALGSFNDFFLRLPSESMPTIYEDNDLPPGEPNIVETNQRIARMVKGEDSPIDFMDQALGYIEQRKRTMRDAVGPENYATSLKYYADIYADLDDTSGIDTNRMRRQVKQNLDGFFKVAAKDMPNYIEMTNIYAAIRKLPEGMVDAKSVQPLLEYTARLLPDYTVGVTGAFLRALPKLNLGENGEAAAELVNLAIRKGKHFETTSDLRNAVRAITVLPKSLASDKALSAVFTYRNNLENSLDVSGADEIMSRLRDIAESVVDSNELYKELKQVAASVGRSALARAKDNQREGVYTAVQSQEAMQVMQRIKANFDAI